MPSDNVSPTEQLPHILVIDDSRLMRRAIGKLLGKLYRVSEAGDGEEGFNIIQEVDDIQLVFSDLSMPKLDGYGLLKKIRNDDNERINKLPVIIITGEEDSDENKQLALSNGASDFISKPFDSAQLRARAKTHIQIDKTHRKLSETETKLEQQTSIDELTGLGNKNNFEQRGNQNLAYAKRHNRELSLLRLDIDGFNKFFLSYGKEAANALLKEISRIALNHVRHEDTAARIGVAKLVFISPSTNRIGARRLAERICKQIQELKFEFGGIAIPVTASIGIAAVDITDDLSLNDLLHIAENHLHLAIEQGGNKAVLSEDIEDDVATEVAEAETSVTEIAVEVEIKQAPIVAETKIPNLDEATTQAQTDNTDALLPHLSTLLKKLLPLLKLCNTKLNLGIDDAIKTIEERLQ